VDGRTTESTIGRSVASLGEITHLFGAALRGSFRRPFYWRELLEQCRFILTANFVPLLLTGLGFGTIVSLEAGHFFRSAGAEYRLGGFTVMSNIREFSPVATGLMSALAGLLAGLPIVQLLEIRRRRAAPGGTIPFRPHGSVLPTPGACLGWSSPLRTGRVPGWAALPFVHVETDPVRLRHRGRPPCRQAEHVRQAVGSVGELDLVVVGPDVALPPVVRWMAGAEERASGQDLTPLTGLPRRPSTMGSPGRRHQQSGPGSDAWLSDSGGGQP
jgi:hypothetical protein